MGADSACVVVPVYNEAAVLGDVLLRLRNHFEHVICVDDGSSDDSRAIALAAGATVLRHPVNLGQGAALQTGFDYVLRHTDFGHVVTFDADGQHDPADAAAMLDEARQREVDVVLGSRVGGATAGQPATRRLLLRGGVVFTRWATGLPVSDTHNGLRVLSRDAVAAMQLRQRGMAHASELLGRIADHRLSWLEFPVSISYTAYSRGKGQHSIEAVNVLFDLMSLRLGSSS